MLNCLDYYRKGFEPVEEWFRFRTDFIAFVDSIRHQMMKYRENMIRLLDPIVVDNDTMQAMVGNASQPQWSDGSLDLPMKQRLASEHERFMRIIQRMEELTRDLERLLRIEHGEVKWIGSEEQRPWSWHLERVRISFFKGKTKKVNKLAKHNQELQDILGYSERVIPIADRRKVSSPVVLFDKMRQLACSTHSALVRNWKCQNRTCRVHQANLCLRADTKNVHFNVLFVIEDDRNAPPRPRKQEVTIQQVADHHLAEGSIAQLANVKQAEVHAQTQQQFMKSAEYDKGRTMNKIFSKLSGSGQPGRPNAKEKSAKPEKQVQFAGKAPTITVSQTHSIASSHQSATLTATGSNAIQRIADLCSSLNQCASMNQWTSLGIIVDECNHQYHLCRPKNQPLSLTSVPNTARLVALPEIIKACHAANINIERHRRFEMSLHIASALLQVQMSPWLSKEWSKSDFFFLADLQNVYSDYPYVSQTFMTGPQAMLQDNNSSTPVPSASERDTRNIFFTVGVMILELIFGHNIEACSFRSHYYSTDGRPNDQTDVCAARKWSEKVLGECGIEVADVVRRCLDCSFGPKPDLNDKRFREAVYLGVIRPLADYLKIWQAPTS
ncbi:MAG: hypothetical protein Q9164_004664 [Protoblastenia rupestris]